MAILTVSRTRPIARKKPITGDNTMKYAILLTPAIWTTPHPPFMKSKPRATATTRTTISNGTIVDTMRTFFLRLGVLEDNVPDNLDNILTLVSYRLHQFVDLFELDN